MQLNLNFNPFPLLQTQRLWLRALLPTDVQDLHNLRSDTSVLKYLNRPGPSSVSETADFLNKVLAGVESSENIMWGISLLEDHKLMGTIGIWDISTVNFRAQTGYMLLPQYQRQGYMYEALSSVISYGFDVMHLHTMEANCNPANTASMQLLEKCNFVKEAHFKENYYYDGKFLDSVVYSLINQRQ
jgi:ribosomal-protein-alanine N-acetyltransferase